ncbi:sugar porter family MFS transporter [Mycolicibacterium sp. P1-5]|uniref:sugar porter family MFS transporter n=1 Tax=Mycolicibacterium sp. P1-5 TaxID=2024617 RepID=UPI0011EDCB2C|nr:sugar porter family MFS transporter [Mycolicibacterium sp. P1-5]KAA0109556.1 MFS transporter [Mycolicibacterium sp. P1-5]
MRSLQVGIASLGGLLFGYETAVLSTGVLHSASSSWGSVDLVPLTTATLLGAAIGALAAGRVADLVGRRDVIMTTAALFTMGAFMSAVAPSSTVLLVGRLVVGIAVGANSMAAPLYIAEIAPVNRRGSSICVFQLMITVGILLAYVGNEMFAQTPDGWRYLLGAGAVPGLALSVLALLLVESPVWLAIKGDQKAALKALGRLGRGDGPRVIQGIDALADDRRSAQLAQVFSLAGRTAIVTGVGLFLVQQFVGINAIVYHLPHLKLGEALGLGGRHGLMFAIFNTLATFVPLVLIDRIGRRPLLLTSLAGIAAGLVAMSVAGALHSNSDGAQLLSEAGLYVFIVSFAIGLGPVTWVLASEILPIHVRGLAMGVVVASHWFFDSLASPTGRLLDHRFGEPIVLGFYACVALAGLAMFWKRIPETKRRSLAAIDRAFKAKAAKIKESNFIHYAVAILATIGGVLTGYNFGVTAVTLVLVTEEWKLDALQQGALASALIVGLAVGSFVAGPLSDRFGRRYVLMSMAALFVASAFGAALSPSLGWLLVARAAAGVAIGLTGPTAGIYVAEVAPAHIRGRLLSFDALAFCVGGILAYCVGLALKDAVGGWRLMFGFIALPSVIYGLALLPLPESPRWLVASGELNAARRSMLRLVGVQVDREGEADRQLAAITAVRPGSTAVHGTPGGWVRLWQPTYRPAMTVGLTMMFVLVFSGIDMVAFYAPTILTDIGFGSRTVTFTVTLGFSVVNLVMTVVSIAIIDRVGRKPLMVGGLLVMAAGLVGFAALRLADHTSELVRWGQIGCLVVLGGTFALALGMVGEIVVAEMYPQSIRGPATSLSHGMRSVFTIVFTLTFPLLLATIGLPATVLSYAVVSIVGAICILRGLPETKGKNLEDIGEYWGVQQLAGATGQSGFDHRGQ